MKKLTALLLSAMLVLSLGIFAACGEQGSNPDAHEPYDRSELKAHFLKLADEVEIGEDTVSFTDASGADRITVKKNPAKVYNLYASFTTLWHEAGGTSAGVIGGSSSAATYTEYIGRDISQDDGVIVLATSSSGKKWDTESIVSGQPDLIICSTAMSGYDTISGPAKAAGIPVIAVGYDTFQDYLKWFKVFCNLTGESQLWEQEALKALDEVVDVLMEIPLTDNPTLFSMFSSASSLQSNLSTTVVGEMAKMMRAENIADNWYNATGAQRLDINLETVFARQPDIIMVQCHGETEEIKAFVQSTYGNNPVWQALEAVKEGKVYYLEKILFHNKPNRKFALAYQVMAKILYPDTVFSFEAEENVQP